jgi:hypothetical protein
MYDEDAPHTAATTAAATGILGLSAWLSWTIAAVIIFVVLLTVVLRLWSRRQNG